MWKDAGSSQVIFQCKVKERNIVVISGGAAEVLAKPLSKL